MITKNNCASTQVSEKVSLGFGAYLVVLFAFFFSCSMQSKHEAKELFYQERIDQIKHSCIDSSSNICEVNFTTLFDSISWDSILVVLPYTPENQLRGISIDNKKSVMSEMLRVSNVDWLFGLFFIKDNTFVAYTILDTHVYFRIKRDRGQLPILKRSHPFVNLVKHRTEKGKEEFYFESSD